MSPWNDPECQPAVPPTIDQQRASRLALSAFTARTVGNESLVVPLAPPNAGKHFIVSQLSALGICTVNPPASPQGPATGLFLVPLPSVGESLEAGQAGINFTARGIVLPSATQLVPLAGGQIAFQLTWTGTALIVPSGWCLVLIINCNPGTLVPGPGPNSVGTLSALQVAEDDA